MYALIYIMYALNKNYIAQVAKLRGFSGIKPLLNYLGLHRNTLDRYSNGASVLPSSIEAVLEALEIPIEKATYSKAKTPQLPIDSLVEAIHSFRSDISVFLFGSRARGNPRKYSDYDLGIYSQKGIILDDYLKVLEIKEQYEDSSSYRADCVNLNNADKEFLVGIMKDIRMLVGYEKDLNYLKIKAYEE